MLLVIAALAVRAAGDPADGARRPATGHRPPGRPATVEPSTEPSVVPVPAAGAAVPFAAVLAVTGTGRLLRLDARTGATTAVPSRLLPAGVDFTVTEPAVVDQPAALVFAHRDGIWVLERDLRTPARRVTAGALVVRSARAGAVWVSAGTPDVAWREVDLRSGRQLGPAVRLPPDTGVISAYAGGFVIQDRSIPDAAPQLQGFDVASHRLLPLPASRLSLLAARDRRLVVVLNGMSTVDPVTAAVRVRGRGQETFFSIGDSGASPAGPAGYAVAANPGDGRLRVDVFPDPDGSGERVPASLDVLTQAGGFWAGRSLVFAVGGLQAATAQVRLYRLGAGTVGLPAPLARGTRLLAAGCPCRS